MLVMLLFMLLSCIVCHVTELMNKFGLWNFETFDLIMAQVSSQWLEVIVPKLKLKI